MLVSVSQLTVDHSRSSPTKHMSEFPILSCINDYPQYDIAIPSVSISVKRLFLSSKHTLYDTRLPMTAEYIKDRCCEGIKRYAKNSSSTQGRIFELRPPDPLPPSPPYYMQYIIPTICVGNIYFWLSTFRFI
jgi:hypothetical protein